MICKNEMEFPFLAVFNSACHYSLAKIPKFALQYHTFVNMSITKTWDFLKMPDSLHVCSKGPKYQYV